MNERLLYANKQAGEKNSIMYRAIITSIGPTAERSVYQLRKELINQFINSPMCESVVINRDPVILDRSLDAVKNPKLTVSATLEDLSSDNIRNFLVIPHERQANLEIKNLDGVTAIGSLFRKSDDLKGLLSGRIDQADTRLSFFRVGHVMHDEDPSFDCIPVSNTAKLREHLYPIASQFLPARFREISPKHLALAVRLNFETCEFTAGTNGVEELDFVDCMKIIGLEECI